MLVFRTMKKLLIVFVVLALAALASIGLFSSQNQPGLTQEQANSQIITPDNTNEVLDTPTVQQESSQNTNAASGMAQYLSYSADAVQEAKGRTVLFFHAQWCPFCREADMDIIEKLSTLPADLTILKTDFDQETNLKKKYGVVYQHTFVQVDAEGNELRQWSGGGAENILQQISS